MLSVDGQSEDLLLKDGLLLALLWSVAVFIDVIFNHANCRGLYSLLILLDSPDLKIFVLVVVIGH